MAEPAEDASMASESPEDEALEAAAPEEDADAELALAPSDSPPTTATVGGLG